MNGPLIDIIAGARPNFMKIAPIIRAIQARQAAGSALVYRLVHTGQHYDEKMSGDFFRQLGIPHPDVNLEVGSGTQAKQTASIMVGYEKLLLQQRSALCLVVGDVTSTMACAIAAQKLGVPVAHVEAGIRSGDWGMPEEINRMVTDAITNWFFTTSEVANANLRRSGVGDDRIFFVGNTMIDTLLANLERLRPPAFWDEAGLTAGGYLVVTLHRPANVDTAASLARVLHAIADGARGLPVVFPVHPRTAKTLAALQCPASLRLVDPQPYLEFNYLVRHARGVITDSGGITEETTVMGVPCMTLRDSTERPETVTTGTNELTRHRPCRTEARTGQAVCRRVEKGRDPGEVGRAYGRANRRPTGRTARLMAGVGTLWRTVRHLKARQLLGRIVFRLARPRVDLRAAPARRVLGGAWVEPARRAASLVAPTRWRLLNQEGDLSDLGWDNPGAEKLWRYNQHYFDDLNATAAPERREWHAGLLSRWVADNPPAQGSGWEPYPTSLRIVNWMKWWLAGAPATPEALHSLAVQARWLRQRLEWHLLGNHLFANAKALVFAGFFFDGGEAAEWLACGLRILARELPEQVLADGGQFERSPMYHALALEDVLDLINIARTAGDAAPLASDVRRMCEQRAPAMLHWLRCMSHPDGEIGFFNDAAPGIAPSNIELERYAAALGVAGGTPVEDSTLLLAPSGYVRTSRGEMVALIDVAPVGPDYLPGHAHADTLSFELSLRGRRVVVNGGTSRYGLGAERLRERGTAAHSTVQVGGIDSSEVWSGFRVGRRARPFDVVVSPNAVHASHDGYAWLAGRPVHNRLWQIEDGVLVVEDRVRGGDHAAVARFHLAPGLTIDRTDEATWEVRCDGAVVACVNTIVGRSELLPSCFTPAFGVVVPIQMLAVHLIRGHAKTRWTWSCRAHPVPE